MSKEQRQRLLLGGLLLVMLVVAWRQLGPSLWGSSRAAESRTPGQAITTGSGSEFGALEVVELRLEDLEKISGQFSPGRDPFRFGQPVATPVEPPEDRDEEAAREAAALAELRRAIEAQRLQESTTPGRVVLPDLDVKFLGSFGSRQRRLAVFSDGVEIFNVLEGDVLKDHFVIRQIGFESVDVGFVDYPDAPAIRLAAGG